MSVCRERLSGGICEEQSRITREQRHYEILLQWIWANVREEQQRFVWFSLCCYSQLITARRQRQDFNMSWNHQRTHSITNIYNLAAWRRAPSQTTRQNILKLALKNLNRIKFTYFGLQHEQMYNDGYLVIHASMKQILNSKNHGMVY